ncbi:distal tail protein Dit [Lactiplantibacillus fabifermentans]|uniref:Siphovirus-type tail component RIFT-related domain-containing protein n=1 Tax=Lactiplantibacillus fabifermentans DSM 21115 TaxID=1413187 RepID=A0A0R2NS33_9LACO|nr:distal tail protein Dit [Lactiplantibacillus fabifermentans]KRO28470.1 hypothetical protein DY78_GL002369 [Lactiplantibacillus fabifermentans DSM 21115]
MIIDGISNNELGITFNGIHSRTMGLKMDSISNPLPTLTDTIQDVQPIIGDLYQGTDVQSKTISITFTLYGAKSYQEKQKALSDIWAWLMPVDGQEYALTLDTLPNRTYYAHVSATFDVTDSLYRGTFTVPFTCSDPRAYGPMRQYQIGARNLAKGTGDVFTSTGVVGEVAQLYLLDVDNASYSGTMSLTFGWTSSNTATEFKIRKAVVDDDGTTTYTDLCSVSPTASSGTETVSVAWQPIAGDEMAYLSYQQLSGTAQVQISDLQLSMVATSGFKQVINAATNEADNTLIDINTDDTVTLHDEESNTDSFPVFILEPKQAITKIAIAEMDSDNYLYMGSEVDVDSNDEVVDNEPTVVHDTCQTLDYWHPFTNPSDTSTTAVEPPFTIANGIIGIDSALRSNPNTIGVATESSGAYRFGTSFTESKWNGPGALHNAFPGAYSDWEITVRFDMTCNYPRAMGKIDLYLLDQNNARMGRIFLTDQATSEDVYLGVEIGTDTKSKKVYYSEGTVTKGKNSTVSIKVYKNGTKAKSTVTVNKKSVVEYTTEKRSSSTSTGTFTNFYGDITLRKVGQKYTASIMRLNRDGTNAWTTPITSSYTDTADTYTTPNLANCAVYIAKYPISEDVASPVKGYKNDNIYLCDLLVKEIKNGGNDEVTTPTPIAEAGDEIHLNTADGTIYKNGQLFNSANGHLIKAAGSNLTGLSLQGNTDKTLSFYPIDGWSISHQSVFY